MTEKRKDPRVGFDASAEVKFSSWAAFYEVYTENISRGGMMLQMSRAPKLGDVVEIKLHPPNGEKITLRGEVKFVAEPKGLRYGVGVEFIELDEGKIAMIEKIIDDAI